MLDETRRRCQHDALFHARVKMTQRVLDHEGLPEPPETIALILHAQDTVQLNSPVDPLFGDPDLHRALMARAVLPPQFLPSSLD